MSTSIQGIGVSGTPAYPQSTSTQYTSNFAPVRQSFNSLNNALLSGDMSGAQSAFASLQQAVSGAQPASGSTSVLSQLGDSGSTLGQDMQAVSSALSANDLSGAQKAYAKLQQDVEATRQANQAGAAGGAAPTHHGGGHHHHAKPAGSDSDSSSALSALSASDSSSSTSSDDLMNALQTLASSNPKVAADLVTLIGDINGSGKIINTTA